MFHNMDVGVWSYRREYENDRAEILAAVDKVFSSGQLILGKSVAGFEEEFASYHGSRHCIGVDNGTNALMLSLRAVGICAGDEVITVANTAAPTVVAINSIGAQPVLVDIEGNGSFLVDVSKIEEAITPKTTCIVVVHLYGQAADMGSICKIAQKYGLAVVEDCAQAHGATYNGKIVGTFGDAAAFSFYPTKILGAYGDGGAVITNNDAIAERIRQLRYYGMKERYFVEDTPGFNSRLDEVQAEILRHKLKKLPGYLSARRAIAARYDEWLADTEIGTPTISPGNEHAYYLYVVRHPKRDVILKELEQVGIHLNVSYRWPIHLMSGFGYLGMKVGDLPITEGSANEIFSLPMYPSLQIDEQFRVIGELRRITESLHAPVKSKVRIT
ncbi:DegT/DnrJ/EryC1/StrS family aminotransferase [Serratia fonticola]|uniref:DegT/DnrJ/EryC1/StrS family aminotransferase n=1 Tax=Serratia fonticola TaxID=47917 RepID=A0ABY9PKW0_SERFO|nr:DegT/DnrJ/EryC1/StrS family aminotransferase [Serratia fonticola]WMT14049.1 DegT/DnrJ/EryC1/StrS family aminotransferase [Serratia fonticola]